ncbi:MAG: alpha/beta fold hydrolase [Proteobacteria bacterium]|nr:alpha/beta fold hydrolase [Pseudomonadota bacterium]
MTRLPLPYDRKLNPAVREEYPWQGRYLRVGENIRMHYLDVGRGKPLLMLHGNPTWSFYYRNLIKAFSDEYRCVVPDHVGCGLSDRPSDEQYGYTLNDRLDNIGHLIEAMDLDDITLVVHDWGGAIGMGTALRYPDQVKRLIVFNTAAFNGPVPKSIQMCMWPGWGDFVVRGLNGFVRAGFQRGFADKKNVTKGLKAGYLAPYHSWASRIAVHRFVQDIPMTEEHKTWRTINAIDNGLAQLKDLPQLLMWGNDDFCFTPEFRKRFEDKWPDAEVHSWDDAGHFVLEEKLDEIVPLMRDFLTRHPIERNQ